MIPVLYEATETAFTSNGLGRLSDCVSCTVTEERNGVYELEAVYPITGAHYADIEEGKIILAQPFDGGLTQPFVIYKITRPLSGLVTINAEHISYRLNNIVVLPFTAGSLAQVMADLPQYSATTNPFRFTTDVNAVIDYVNETPRECRAILGGQQGSILDVYGGGYDYEFNRFDVILHTHRGADNNVTLRYGKNITDLTGTIDATGVYNGIVPYYTDDDGAAHMLPEVVVMSSVSGDKIKPVDFSAEFTQADPTEAELRAAAQSYLANNRGWLPNDNLTVSFVALWNTEEYKNIAPLERVHMGDTVHIIYNKLGIDTATRVIRTVYDVLLERYNEITLGDTTFNLSMALNNVVDQATANANEAVRQASSHMADAIQHATELIQGGLGGHVYFNTNSDGEPEEILIMDTDSIQTAVNVIRINQNGIGFSTTGYNGPFTTAWTIDGHFVADFIDTGDLNASVIKSGVLSDLNGNIEWNLSTGEMTAGALTIDSPYFDLDENGKITSTGTDGKKLTIDKAVISGYKADGTLSASLEIGDGLFNIAEGALAIKGNVGISDACSPFYSVLGHTITRLKDIELTTKKDTFLTDETTLSGGSCTFSKGTFSTKTITFKNQYGNNETVTVVTGYTTDPKITYSAPSLSKKTEDALTSVTKKNETEVITYVSGLKDFSRIKMHFNYGLFTQAEFITSTS